MRRLLAVLAVLAAALAAATINADVVVAIHGHSNFSDGSEGLEATVASMRSGGADAAIVTDHAEVLNSPEVPQSCLAQLVLGLSKYIRNPNQIIKEAGIYGWKEAYRQVLQATATVPAMEFGLIARSADKPTDRFCHFLFIGGGVEEQDKTYDELVKLVQSERARDGGQVEQVLDEAVALAKAHNAVVIAAHPTNPDWSIGGNLVRMVDGVEMMNHHPMWYPTRGDNPKALLEKLLEVPQAPLVTAGIDWHGIAGEEKLGQGSQQAITYNPSPKRFTVLLTDDRSPSGLMGALQSRRCYAAFGGARITQGKELIGGEVGFDQPFEMSFEGISANKAWLACRSDDGISCRKVVEVPMNGDRLAGRLDEMLGLSAGGMSQGGWIVVAAPAGTPQVITSGIKVTPAGAGDNSEKEVADLKQRLDKALQRVSKMGPAQKAEAAGLIQPFVAGQQALTLEAMRELVKGIEGIKKPSLLEQLGDQLVDAFKQVLAAKLTEFFAQLRSLPVVVPGRTQPGGGGPQPAIGPPGPLSVPLGPRR